MKNLLVLFLACVFVTGCGAGANTTAAPLTSIDHRTTETTPITIRVAVPSSSKAGYRPAFVSSATKSISVSVTASGGTAGPFVGNCPEGFCSQLINAPIGSDTFTVSLYSASNASGTLLSNGTTVALITAGANNDVSITFDPVVVSAAAAPSIVVLAGEPTSVPFTVQARDPNDALIIPPGDYDDAAGITTPIGISLNGPNSHYALTGQRSFASPAPAEASPDAYINYDGSAPDFSYDTLYFSIDKSSISKESIPILPNNIKPGVLLAGNGYTVQSAARGADGNIYFTAFGSAGDEIGKFDTSSSAVTAFPQQAGSNPGQIVSGADGKLYFFEPGTTTFGQLTPPGTLRTFPISYDAYDLTKGVDGEVWFTSNLGIQRINTAGVITTVTTVSTDVPNSLTIGPDSRMWFLSCQDFVGCDLDSIAADGSGLNSVSPSNIAEDSGIGLFYAPDGYFYTIASFTNQLERFSPSGAASNTGCGFIPTAGTVYSGTLSDGTVVFSVTGSSDGYVPHHYLALLPNGTCAFAGEPASDRFLSSGIVLPGSSAGYAYDIIGNTIYDIEY